MKNSASVAVIAASFAIGVALAAVLRAEFSRPIAPADAADDERNPAAIADDHAALERSLCQRIDEMEQDNAKLRRKLDGKAEKRQSAPALNEAEAETAEAKRAKVAKLYREWKADNPDLKSFMDEEIIATCSWDGKFAEDVRTFLADWAQAVEESKGLDGSAFPELLSAYDSFVSLAEACAAGDEGVDGMTAAEQSCVQHQAWERLAALLRPAQAEMVRHTYDALGLTGDLRAAMDETVEAIYAATACTDLADPTPVVNLPDGFSLSFPKSSGLKTLDVNIESMNFDGDYITLSAKEDNFVKFKNYSDDSDFVPRGNAPVVEIDGDARMNYATGTIPADTTFVIHV